jgi:hypothetical protein
MELRMKSTFRVYLSAFMLLLTACANVNLAVSTPSPVPRGPDVLGAFEGNTPCSAQARPLPQIRSDTDCEQMIWSLVLFQDPQTGNPTTYRLNSAFGLPKPNTNDLVGGGTSVSMEGKWTITTGTKSDPEATVYQINPDDARTTVSFQKINDNLIHVLSSDNTMLVGNGAWSYTLNRMDNQITIKLSDPSSFSEPPTRPPQPPMPEGSSVLGVFDGRTPCHELVIEFTNNESFPGCLKIKWRLTLYQDAATGSPSTYLYMGTSGYREGSWTIVNGVDGNPDAVVYQLQLRDAQEPVSFLKVDENHLFLMDRAMNLLVGNELFSYTLSRTDQGIQ